MPYLIPALAMALAAQACGSSSPARRVALVELYTSEGCSSCPPTDAYIGGLRAAGVTQDQAVLLALHVDYWDRLGWKDVYARPAFTARQQWIAGLGGSGTVYTPEVFVSGREQYPVNKLREAVARANQLAAGADLRLSAQTSAPGQIDIAVQASAAEASQLHIALTEDDIATKVKAGENGGRILHHHAVARTWLDPVPLRPAAAGQRPSAQVQRSLPLPPQANPARTQLVAFVQNARGEVLQAWSMPICVASR